MGATKTCAGWDVRHTLEAGDRGLLIDVRTPVEYRAAHAEGSVNIPYDALNPERLRALGHGEGQRPIYLLCRSGVRAKMACEKLQHEGMAGTAVVEGGTEAWEQAGLPMVRGKKAVSLERQVRIVAGSIALAGSVLAAFVHPWFWVVPAFIGGGLAFAGITDSCAMGMLLARMPWNRIADPTCQA